MSEARRSVGQLIEALGELGPEDRESVPALTVALQAEDK